MLFVDLDKSLIKTDSLYECFISYLSTNIFAIFMLIYVILNSGLVGLKKFLYIKGKISVENLPFNEKVLTFIENWRKNNRDKKVYLISASYHKIVEEVAKKLDCFDGYHGTNQFNLKSEKKLQKIKDICKGNSFTYVGDSFDDLVIWEKAEQCVAVNPSNKLMHEIKKINTSFEIIQSKEIPIFNKIIKAIRVHQWVKNTLIFVPAILAMKPIYGFLGTLLTGFIAFSMIASALYILNDLFDLENDRKHHSKKFRAFASGSLSILNGVVIFCVLLFFGIILASKLSDTYQLILAFYALSSYLYTKFLKQIPIVDIFTLSFFYLLRLISGGVLMEVSVSNWLLTFSVFFFLFLASAKRWIELKRTDFGYISGRGYQSTDVSFIRQLSYFSGLISVLIICLYLDSEQAQILFGLSGLMWLVPAIILYWTLEILFKIERGKVDDDIVIYALKSKSSYISLIGFLVIFSLSLPG